MNELKDNSFSPLISCVIPVYNAEKYLVQGIESLLSQTYENIEIVLVDDQSTDGSWAICEDYAENHENIRIFKNKVNSGGPLRGREKGVKEARGEWITFMDCDDFVRPKYLEHLLEATDGGTYDVAVTGHIRMYEDGQEEPFRWGNYTQTSNERIATFYRHFLQHDFWTDPTDTSGQNLIRASLFDSIDLSRYSSTVYAEDTLLALLLASVSKNGINFVDHHDFVWRQVEGSGSHGGFSDRANKDEFYSACMEVFHEKELYETISKQLPLVSIIVPIYNVETYLEDCLESVLAQTYENIEVILINDGSEDKSQKIIDKYATKDKRFKAIFQENAGLNMARAAGFKEAHGEYVAFVDSDDIVHKDYIKLLFETLVINNADISLCALKNFSKKGDYSAESTITPDYKERRIPDRKGSLEYYLLQSHATPGVHHVTAWGKLYRHHLIKGTDWTLSNYRRHEDNLESLQWYNAAERGIAIISTELYFYRNNPTSITKTNKKNVAPDGREIGYFQFLREMYEAAKDVVNEPSFDKSITNYFSHLNRLQIKHYVEENMFTADELDDAIENLHVISKDFNTYIQQSNDRYELKEREVQELLASKSWQATEMLRMSSYYLKKVKSKIIRKK